MASGGSGVGCERKWHLERVVQGVRGSGIWREWCRVCEEEASRGNDVGCERRRHLEGVVQGVRGGGIWREWCGV